MNGSGDETIRRDSAGRKRTDVLGPRNDGNYVGVAWNR
jgi:hypothetical protein